MPTSPEPFRSSFTFTIPTDRILAIARRFLESPDEKCRAVAKAVLDITREGLAVHHELQSPGSANPAPYFAIWLGDAIDAAHELVSSDDKDARDLATCLLAQEQDAVKANQAFLIEQKRHQSRQT